jgi:glycosyltransferase involved in cell wall biosynthesis
MPAAILHLLGTAQLEGSGVARIVAALAAGLNPAKYHVHAWFLGPPGPLIDDLQAAGATACSIKWWRGVRDPVGAYRFWCRLRDYDFAIVHQHFGARSIRGLIRLSSDARVVVHLHGRVSVPDSTSGFSVAVRGADLVVAASRAVALDVPNLKPIVVHAGLASRREFCARDTGPKASTIIGAACRFVPLKGLVDLIRAVALLRLEFPTLRLEIAGAGPQREDLEGEVERLGLRGSVRLLGWQRDLGPHSEAGIFSPCRLLRRASAWRLLRQWQTGCQ